MASLSLTAYKALAKGTTVPQTDPYPDRPDGPIVWGVAHDDHSARALIYLVERIRQMRGPCYLLLTYVGKPPRIAPRKWVHFHALPVDTSEPSKRFLDHWNPATCIWIGGELRPALISEAKDRALPMSLLTARENLLDQSIWRWLPSLARETLDAFQTLSARDDGSKRALRKMAGARREIAVDGPMQDSVVPPAVNESVFEEVSHDLNGRPVWLAANIQEDELKDVLNAHRASVKITHRLALVLVAASFPVSLEARRHLKSRGWRVCHWEDGDPIEENTQIILVEEPEDLGLWYRIAPFCFLGSSLKSGHGGCDPYLPATLGSAIIYGPNVGVHLSGYSRLAAVGAAQIVKDSSSLSSAIEKLLAADQAASMAHAAWMTTSEGAEASDAAIEDIQAQLDALESQS